MPCKRAVNLSAKVHNLLLRGMTFVPPYGASRLLLPSHTIEEVIHMLFLLLDGWVPPFKEALDWMQSAYTADPTGAYVVLASTVLVQSVVSEGDIPFYMA